MNQSKILLLILLFSALHQISVDDCLPYEIDPETGILEKISVFPNVKKYMKKAKQRVWTFDEKGFEVANIVVTFEGQKHPIVLEQYKKKTFATKHMLAMRQLSPNFLSGNFLTCQYDNDFYYVAKKRIDINDLCNPIDVSVEKSEIKTKTTTNEKISMDDLFEKSSIKSSKDLPLKFEQNTNLLGKGGFGEVKEFKVSGLSNIDQFAVKKVLFDSFQIKELYVMKMFSKSKYGIELYGCYYNDENVYIFQEKLDQGIDNKKFTEWFLTLSDFDKANFFVELASSLKEFIDMGFVHLDIKNANIMVDKNKGVHLIDYGFASLIGEPDFNGLTRAYSSEERSLETIANPKHDIYAMALTIVSLLSTKNSDIIYLKFGKYEKIEEECRAKKRPDICQTYLTNMILGLLANTWGDYRPDIIKIESMNLTTLMMKIIVERIAITNDQFLTQLKNIAKSKKTAKVENTSQLMSTLNVKVEIEGTKFSIDEFVSELKKFNESKHSETKNEEKIKSFKTLMLKNSPKTLQEKEISVKDDKVEDLLVKIVKNEENASPIDQKYKSTKKKTTLLNNSLKKKIRLI